jgi:hypothetical protein
MRVILACTKLDKRVVLALIDTQRHLEIAWVTDSDDAYFDLLSGLWTAGESFIVVEHDVLVRSSSLDELEGCSSPWCAFQVSYVGTTWAGLSCAKFTAELMGRYPNAFTAISEASDVRHPPKHWCRIDSWLRGYLGDRDETLCEHAPPLEHRPDTDHVMPSHDCWY